MTIAVIGSNMVDLITYTNSLPKAGETLEAPDFAIGCGGKGANQAVAAAKMGGNVMMVSKVGDDLFAPNTVANLQQQGVDTRFVTTAPGTSSGVAPIFVDDQSQNRILIIKGANQQLKPADIDDAAEALKACQLIILQLEIPLETVYYAIDFARQHQITVILNPAPAVATLDIDYACKCDFFMPNETELEILTGLPVSSDEEVILAGQSLLKRGLKNLIITLGQPGIGLDERRRDPSRGCHTGSGGRHQRRGRCLYRLLCVSAGGNRRCGRRHDPGVCLCRLQRHRARHPARLSRRREFPALFQP
ncbi:Ribokinase [Pantoea agglomerans]|uniref:Deoxyribokinase n=1 Tax=Enterobacter agglomerans TaxID=549 RepID=A0A379ALY2_ENTAG|nr:Ribokinase [Pantoea agglomerans]